MRLRTTSARETQKIASLLAREAARSCKGNRALVFALKGALGSGKTTFVQGFASSLGIRERVLSPTFVLMKIYSIRKRAAYTYLVHLDLYRISSPQGLIALGVKKMLRDKDAIVLIEWPERVRRLLPRETVWIRFRHGKKPHERDIFFPSR